MSLQQIKLKIDTWNEYIQVIESLGYEKAKGYYNNKMRIEMFPVGNDHSRDHSIISHAVHQ